MNVAAVRPSASGASLSLRRPLSLLKQTLSPFRDPPNATSLVPICYVRLTSTPAVSYAQIAAIRRWRRDRGSARARALIGLISCKPPGVGRVNSPSLFHTTRSPASARGRLRGRMATAPCPTSKLINSPCHPCRRLALPEPPSSSASRRPWPRWLS
jgi:hypothetical protein